MEALKAKMSELKQEMVEVGKRGIHEEFQKIFAQWPEAQAIRWAQYTPYFNDGDPCVFGVNEATVKISDEGGDDDDGYLSAWELEDESVGRTLLTELDDALETCKDALRATFGDHCQVTIWRDKTEAEVEEYEHD